MQNGSREWAHGLREDTVSYSLRTGALWWLISGPDLAIGAVPPEGHSQAFYLRGVCGTEDSECVRRPSQSTWVQLRIKTKEVFALSHGAVSVLPFPGPCSDLVTVLDLLSGWWQEPPRLQELACPALLQVLSRRQPVPAQRRLTSHLSEHLPC